MAHQKQALAGVLRQLDLGSSVAEQDNRLEQARVETSVFGDLFLDKIDLIPGTKGSGKSALYRIFVDFLAPALLDQRKIVVAHGVQHHGDSVFLAFKEMFDQLSEEDFVSFWCIYLVSLAHEQFVKGDTFGRFLSGYPEEVESFRRACQAAGIPEIRAKLTLRDVLGWALAVLKSWKPKLTYTPPSDVGEFGFDLFGSSIPAAAAAIDTVAGVPRYISRVTESLEELLTKANVTLWLMIDKLDEIFPRRSKLETLALRGLLRTFRVFDSPRIRIKVFLRDDILEQVVASGEGFTALTHVTARQSDTLKWSEDQILTMIVKRLFAYGELAIYCSINAQKLSASRDYQKSAFYEVFPPTIYPGTRKSPTLRWIYSHVADGRGVVTPRDVIELLTRAKQWQCDEFSSDPSGTSDWIIGPAAIRYGLTELSKRKRTTILEAEFPHLWPHIKKFVGGKTEYPEPVIRDLLGKHWTKHIEDLVSIGVLTKTSHHGRATYKIPFVYRDGLEVTQGRMLDS